MVATQGKPIQCKAAVCWTPNTEMTIETITVDPPKAGEVRIKMVSSGICYSDITVSSGCLPHIRFPIIMGHEGNGVVESVGEGVRNFKQGDHVFPLFNPQCDDCKLCRTQYANTCESKYGVLYKGVMMDGTSRFHKDGKVIYSQSAASTYTEYTVVPDICLAKVSKEAPLEKLSMYGCCMLSGYGAVFNTAKVHPGSTVAIWGLGGVGLCVALGCQKAGAKMIIGVDPNPEKFVLGKTFGCTQYLNSLAQTKPMPEVIKEITGGGADFTFVCVGKREAFEEALEATHRGFGQSIVLGFVGGEGIIGADPQNLIFGKTWKGSYCGGYRAREAIPELVDKYMAGEFPQTDLLITNRIALDKINDGFDQLKKGKQIRTVIIF